MTVESPSRAFPRGVHMLNWVWAAPVIIVFCFSFTLLFSPWAFFIGGRLTPLMTWHGVGTFKTSATDSSIVFLDLSFARSESDFNKTADLAGTADICRPGHPVESWKARLHAAPTWIDTDGQTVDLVLSRPNGQSRDAAQQSERMEFKGVWRNPDLMLEGKTGQPPWAAFTYASRAQFDSLCQGR